MALPYVLNNGNLGKFLEHIKTARVPDKLDEKFLASGGFTGKNDLYLRGYMKHLGFTDNQGVPKQRWHDHRHDADAKKLRGQGVREAYKGFFDMYPDAPKRSDADFENWARAEDPKASPTTVTRALKTFQTMVKLSDFDGTASSSSDGRKTPDPPKDEPPKQEQTPPPPPPPATPSFGMGGITINIELQLPPTADAEFFDAFFAAMRKHLKDE